MKQFLTLLAFIFGVVVSQQSLADNGPRSPWYIGFGVGFSPNAEFEDGGETHDFEYWSESDTNAVVRFKVGATLHEKHLLGGDFGFVSSVGSDAGGDYLIMMSHEMVSYTFFPATKGFFLHTGLGLGHLTLRADNTIFGDFEGRNDGTAVMFGVGYSFWIGRTFNIAVNLDHEVHNYSSSSGDFVDMDSASATQLYVSFDWY